MRCALFIYLKEAPTSPFTLLFNTKERAVETMNLISLCLTNVTNPPSGWEDDEGQVCVFLLKSVFAMVVDPRG